MQVDVKQILSWYAVTPRGVEARIRSYASGKAFEERSENVDEATLTTKAQLAGRPIWTEEDVATHFDSVWAKGQAEALDVYAAEDIGAIQVKG